MATLTSLPRDASQLIFSQCAASDALALEIGSRALRENEGLAESWPSLYENLRISMPECAGKMAREKAHHVLVELALKEAFVGCSVARQTLDHAASGAAEEKEDAVATAMQPLRLVVPKAPLYMGERSTDVLCLHQALIKLGFMQKHCGGDDDVFNARTKDALLTFQFRHIHTIDRRMADTLGTFGLETEAALAREVALWEASLEKKSGEANKVQAEARRIAAQSLRLTWNDSRTLDLEPSCRVRESAATLEAISVATRARLIVLGGRRAGVSSLVGAFLGKPFNDTASARQPDMAVFGSHVTLCGVPVKLRITDKRATARRTPFSWKLYAGADAAVLVCFSVRDKASLHRDAASCLAEVHSHTTSRLVSDVLPVFLVGCQADDNDGGGGGSGGAPGAPRAVSFRDAEAFAAARGLPYIETSAYAGRVDAPFLLAALAVARNNGWLPVGREAEARHRARTGATKLRDAAYYAEHRT